MKKICFIAFSFILVMVTTGFHMIEKSDDKPGFSITVNGDQFNNQTFYIPATTASYANLYFDFKEDTRAKRTVLVGFEKDNSLQLLIDVPIHKTTGSYTFIEDNIPVYMGFQFTYEKDGSSATYMPGKMMVSITQYGNVGELMKVIFQESFSRVSEKKNRLQPVEHLK